jgi:multiple sugar transport system permease protein
MAVDVTAVTADRVIPGRGTSHRVKLIVTYTLLIVIALIYFVPFLWSVSTSLKTLPETANFSLIPDHPTFAAYREVLGKYDFTRYALNTAFLASVTTLFNLLLASLGGYAFARLRFPGREVLFMLVLGSLMIPSPLRLVPVFQMLTSWHLVGTYRGLILINLVTAQNLFFMRQYFLTIPRDFEEAAKLDAAGYLKTFWKVMLPLAGPALAAVTILQFQSTWNDFFWPLILLGFGNPDRYTLTLGITQFVFQYQTLWPQLMAASVIGILPIALIFVVFQRYFIAGVVASGVKG